MTSIVIENIQQLLIIISLIIISLKILFNMHQHEYRSI